MNKQVLKLIKNLPVDLGQGTYRHTTRAKQIAFQLAGKGAGKQALDLGCGDGFWTQRLRQNGWQVTSADLVPRFPGAVKADAEDNLPFADSSFDLIWLAEVIEHVRNLDGLRHELLRLLKPNGRLIMTTPNSAFWLYHLTRMLGITPAQIQNPDHKQFFSLSDIRQLFPQAQIYGFFPYNLIKIRISHGVEILSPSFVILHTDMCSTERVHHT